MKKNYKYGAWYDHAFKKTFLIMRLVLIISLICVMQSFAFDSYTQNSKISLSVKQTRLEDILMQIESGTKYRFAYNKTDVDVDQVYTIDIHEAEIKDVLTQLFSDKKISYSVIDDRQIVLSKPGGSFAVSRQSLTISGRVTDSAGAPMPGVTVVVKGTNNGTITNADGSYSLNNISGDATLVFSFVGMRPQEIPVDDKTNMNVTMEEETIGIEEVIAVGYGTQSKSKVSGAITTVSEKDVSISPTGNLGSDIAGRISGVTINNRGGEPGQESVEIFIRGKSTIGDATPLYVIDGIVRDYGALSYIPSSEVESITVLKDASAAIYGSRAANGVILVTTKRGEQGVPIITANYTHGFVQPERIPESADAYTYASMVNLEQWKKDLPQSYSESDLDLYKNGTDPLNHPNTNWQNLIFRPWSNQDRADVSLSGGNQNVKYFVAGGTLLEDSPFKESYTYNKEYHFRSNIDAQVTKNLQVSLDIAGRRIENVASHFDWAHIFLGLPTEVGIYPNGYYGSGRTGFSALSMARDQNYGYNKSNSANFTGTLSAKYKIPGVQGLSLDGNFAYDYDNNYTKKFLGVSYYYKYDPVTETYSKLQNSNTATPSLNIDYPNTYSITSNIRLIYNRIFNQKHAIDAFIAFEQNSTNSYTVSAGRTNYASQSILELFAGDSNKANQSNNGFSAETGRQNLFGRFLYSYKNKYNLQFQFRYDGSQNFPVGKRYGFFPGISGNWNISQENFMKNAAWLDNLKFRASWGQMGNDKIDPYQYLTSYSYGNNYAFNGITNQGLYQTNAPNPTITWEVAKTTNIGIDGEVFNGLLNAQLEVFRTIRSNILATRNASVPAYTGLSLPNENIGRTKNQGIEVNLSHSKKIGKDFKYTIDGNFTYARNTVLFIDETPGIPTWQRATGKSMNTPVLYETIGIFKTQKQLDNLPHQADNTLGDLIYRDVNNDEIIDGLDQVRQKYSTTPRIVYGFNFHFDYKHFDLFLGFQGQAQAIGEKYDVLPFDPVGWGDFPSALAKDVWSPNNPDGNNPIPGQSFASGKSYTTWRYASAAFLKLKTAELGYNFSSQLLSRTGIKNARVFANGSNLFFIHDHFRDINLSPELTNWGWGLSQKRIINLGLSVTF